MEDVKRLRAENFAYAEATAAATLFIKEIGTGNLDALISDEDGKRGSELTEALFAMRDQLKHISDAEKQRNWISEGLAKFVEILRTHNLEGKAVPFYQVIISNLVKYVGANQGALFLVENMEKENVSLELAAAYAYERQKYLKKKIQPGEGLIGQCYLEKETIELTEIPSYYVSITSGLGKATPNYLIIVPLKSNDKVQGIIELASFHRFKPHQIEFLEKLGESLASTFSSLTINQHTQKLLEETLAQAEHMRSQEEELRQNMEELGATQEEMSRVSAEMEGQLSAINKTMATIEFDLKGNILAANGNFLNLFGYTLQEIQGRHHRIFVESTERESDNYMKFWEDLGSGKNTNGEFKRITKSGADIFIQGIYNPIFDQSGNPTKVLKIAYDVTSKKQMELQINQQLRVTKAKEEALTQNMEALSATQDQLSQISAEMESQLAAINKTLAAIEFDLDGNIITANDNFLNLLGYTLEEIESKHHRIFVDNSESNSIAYKLFWQKLASGESENGEFKRNTKSGNTIFIKGIYSPVMDKKGNPIRISKIAYDITELKKTREVV